MFTRSTWILLSALLLSSLQAEELKAPPGVKLKNATVSEATLKLLVKDGWTYIQDGMTDGEKGKGWICEDSIRLMSTGQVGAIMVKFKTLKIEGRVTIGCGYDEGRPQPTMKVSDPLSNTMRTVPTAKCYAMVAVSRTVSFYIPKLYQKDPVAVSGADLALKKDDVVHTMMMTYNGTDLEYFLDDKRIRADHNGTTPGQFIFEASGGAEILELKLSAK